jgi:hypothetical protein
MKSNKTKCKANAVQGDSYCFWHSTKMKSKREQAVIEGGNSPKRSYGRDDEIKIANTRDVLLLIEQTVNDIRQNKISTRTANAVGYLAGIALKAIQQDDFDKRLAVIEYALSIRKSA